jgi:hypothetical protein
MSLEQHNSEGSTGYQANRDINIINVLKNKSAIAEVVNAISKIDLEDENNLGKIKEIPEIEAKIRHNNITKYLYLINDYGLYGKILEGIYETLEQEKPGKKGKLLRVISDFYKAEKGILTQTNDLDIIRDNADLIIENIITKLDDKILKSSNLDAENEDVHSAIQIIVADAFIQCKILEDPNEQ